MAKKGLGDRFQPRDYELLMILFRFVIGMGWYNTNIRHEDLYGDKEPWEIFRWDCRDKYQYFFTQLKRKSKSSMKASLRFDRTVGKKPGTWHGQDKGKPIIDKETGALLGYKRSFLYRNKQEPDQDRQWLLKEFYLNDGVMKVTETYPILEHTKDFVLCRLQRKKRAGEAQERCKDVPIETILKILEGTTTSTETSMEGENEGDMGLLFDSSILNEDPKLLAIQQQLLLEDDNDIRIDACNDFSYFTEEILKEEAAAAGPLGASIYGI